MVPIREYGLRDTDTKDDCRREASVPMARRVVITGLGTINPLASDVHGYWDGLCNGRSGIGPIELFDASAFKVRFGGEVKGFDPESVLDPRMARRMDRFSQFTVTAALEALRDSGVEMEKEDCDHSRHPRRDRPADNRLRDPRSEL
jgi:3-oxoacyl-(acyl-carrier-protein) synthase